MPVAEKKVWTSEDVRRLREAQEGRPFEKHVRYEVVDGELLVTPAPKLPHQRAAMQLAFRLQPYVSAAGLGEIFVNAADVEMDPHTNVQPDLSVVPLVDGHLVRSWDEIGLLHLVVEILSPSTARYDRGKKRLRYQRAGIPEYWIVDLDARVVERWRPEDERPEVLTESLTWQPAGANEPIAIDLPAFFARAWGETPPGAAD